LPPPLRILHGPVEAAGVAGALVAALRRRGHQAELVLMTHPPFGMSCDRLVLGYGARATEGLRAPLRHDVLHFHFNVTFCEYLDAAWGRIAGRPTMIMHFHGDDCRRREVTFANHPARARIYDASVRNERLTTRRLRLAGRLCNAAIVADLELLENVRSFFRAVYVVPAPVNLAPLTETEPPPDEAAGPVVIHAPSNPTIKGTPMIREAIEMVARRRPVRSRLITGVSHEQVMAEMARADIVIDQMNSETPGIFALEGMALGKPVLCEYRKEMLGSFAGDTPLVQVTPDTLADRLEAFCDDRERRLAVGREGARFVRRVHDADRVAKAVERVYEHAATRPCGVYEVTDREFLTLE
jgi:hypothetical protein